MSSLTGKKMLDQLPMNIRAAKERAVRVTAENPDASWHQKMHMANFGYFDLHYAGAPDLVQNAATVGVLGGGDYKLEKFWIESNWHRFEGIREDEDAKYAALMLTKRGQKVLMKKLGVKWNAV